MGRKRKFPSFLFPPCSLTLASRRCKCMRRRTKATAEGDGVGWHFALQQLAHKPPLRRYCHNLYSVRKTFVVTGFPFPWPRRRDDTPHFSRFLPRRTRMGPFRGLRNVMSNWPCGNAHVKRRKGFSPPPPSRAGRSARSGRFPSVGIRKDFHK
ncbi:hypothetical protein PUN28_014853 [Cardiocondyla obscurior]|uniref:Secreted protein n=1 Tax=Cardiocondyla obscurior TaxID=286306 RepID=A0AAW2F0V0_9HYME